MLFVAGQFLAAVGKLLLQDFDFSLQAFLGTLLWGSRLLLWRSWLSRGGWLEIVNEFSKRVNRLLPILFVGASH